MAALRSAEWAGRNGLNLLIGNVVQGEGTDDFHQAQVRHVERFLAAAAEVATVATPTPRIALGRVIVPLDHADAATRRRYLDFAAARSERTREPQGVRRILYPLDLIGSSDEILERLRADPVLPLVDELRLELPYAFAHEDYLQILDDFRRRIAPALGWAPTRA